MRWLPILKLEPEKIGMVMNHIGVFIDLLWLK